MSGMLTGTRRMVADEARSVDVLAARTSVVIPLDMVDTELSLMKWFGVLMPAVSADDAIIVPANYLQLSNVSIYK